MGSALAAAEDALAALAAGDAVAVRQSVEALALCVEVLREIGAELLTDETRAEAREVE